MARLADIACMNDMAVERELYMDTDSEEQVCIDDDEWQFTTSPRALLWI
jgi:hypothetical protein